MLLNEPEKSFPEERVVPVYLGGEGFGELEVVGGEVGVGDEESGGVVVDHLFELVDVGVTGAGFAGEGGGEVVGGEEGEEAVGYEEAGFIDGLVGGGVDVDSLVADLGGRERGREGERRGRGGRKLEGRTSQGRKRERVGRFSSFAFVGRRETEGKLQNNFSRQVLPPPS